MPLGFFATNRERRQVTMKLYRHLAWNAAFCVFLCGASAAYARPATTKYNYYMINGNTIESLYQQMIRRGPHVGGGKAYASTKMDPRVEAVTASNGQVCHIAKFNISMTFTINLPKLQSSTGLSPSVRQSFDNFYSFAKKHEEHHRTIWLGCAAEAEAQVKTISARSCSEAEAQGLQIVQKMARVCDARHMAFDLSEQKRLANHPFIRAVFAKIQKTAKGVVALPVAPIQ